MTVKEQIKNALTMSWAKIKSLCVLNSNVVNSTSGTSTTYPLSAAAGADLQNQINKLNSTLIISTQLNWTDVNATANTPILLKNFSIDSSWNNKTIIGIIPVSIRGYNTSSFIPSIYRQYNQGYFVSSVSQSYDIVVNVLYFNTI